MASLTVRARDKLQPALYADIANGGILDAYLTGLVYPLQEVEDYAADSDDGPGWSIVLDLSRAPDKLMPWLSQFVGVDATVPSGQTPAQIRQAITERPNWKRGTPAAIAAGIRQYLSGNKAVVFRERDTSPYHFTVMTYANETPRVNGGAAAATLSGNLITDAVRAANTSGDGRAAPDSSIGIWEATTNLIPNGGFEANLTGWSAANATLSRDTTRSKFGTASMRSTVTVATFVELGYTSLAGLVAGQAYTLSGWVWIPSSWQASNQVYLVWANAGNPTGFQVNANMALRDQWQRVSTTFIAGITTGSPAWRCVAAPSVGDSLWFDGMQLENKNLPTPYVETNGAAASRTAGRIQLPVSLLSSVQGWVAMRLRMGYPSTADVYGGAAPRLFGWTDSGNDRLIGFYRTTTDAFGIQSAVGGVLAESVSGTQSFAAGDKKTVIFAWTATTVSVSVDGSNMITFPRPSAGSIALPTFDLGSENGAVPADCDYLWAAGGIGALTSADAVVLAALGDTDPDIPSLPVNGIPTFTWKGNDANYILPASDPRIVAAINAVKPAGLQYSYSVLSGQDYTSLLANHPLYSNVFADYATYQGIVTDRPGT
jgi:hypothetical protein